MRPSRTRIQASVVNFHHVSAGATRVFRVELHTRHRPASIIQRSNFEKFAKPAKIKGKFVLLSSRCKPIIIIIASRRISSLVNDRVLGDTLIEDQRIAMR